MFFYRTEKRKLIFTVTLAFLLLTSVTGCGETGDSIDNSSDPEPPLFSIETYPAVDGSTVTIPLSEALMAALTNLPVEDVRPYILHNKTHPAYINLVEKEVDLIFVTSPSVEELELAEAAGVTLEVIPVVSEAFVFLVNSENKVDNLSREEIVKIYSGEITNWNELGGPDVPLIAYQRPLNSGSQTGFLDLVMQGESPMDPPTEQVIADMGSLIDAVAAYTNEPDALGYSYYYFVMDMWGSENIKLLQIDGIPPTPETISSGQYPFLTAYYAVIRADEPENSPARQVIDWLLSEEGQLLAEETGYVRIR